MGDSRTLATQRVKCHISGLFMTPIRPALPKLNADVSFADAGIPLQFPGWIGIADSVKSQ